MPAIDLTDPRILNFYSEIFLKEALNRSRWNAKHKEALEQAATLQRAAKNYSHTDAYAHLMKSGMAAHAQDHKDLFRYRKKIPIQDARPRTDLKHGHSIVDIGVANPKDDPRLAHPDTDTTRDPIMRPIEPKMTEVIYKPRPEFGRVSYLNQRTKERPEDRYYLPECTSWHYGWRLKDCKFSKPQYGRYWYLMRALKNRSGAQPDPKHYTPIGNIKAVCVEPS